MTNDELIDETFSKLKVLFASAVAAIEQVMRERDEARRERDAYLGLIIKPWDRDGDGTPLYKINLAWYDCRPNYEEALAFVCQAAGLPEVPTNGS